MLIYWSSRQLLWARARLTVPAIAVVVATLLAATLRHIDAFGSPLGIVWIEVYVLVGPVVVVPGAVLSNLVLGGARLLALATHPGQLDAADPALWAYAAVWLLVLALGAAGVQLARRDGR